MKILAVDTSCDDSCAAILDVDTWKLLSNVIYSHSAPMEKFGGVVPEIASREHLKALPLAVHEAFEMASLSPKDIDWIVATNRPGLIGSLLVGVSYTKSLAYALQKPWTVIDHVECHLYSPLLPGLENKPTPPFPWIGLVVSGGHTEIFHVMSETKFRWLGGTRDDAAGEAFDKIGKLLGLPYPAGPYLDKWVRKEATGEDRKKYPFPKALVEGYEFSFSGLKSAVHRVIGETEANKTFETEKLRIAASAQEAIVESLVEKATKAAHELKVPQVVVSGGVACNSRLRELMPNAFFPEPKFCTDNAAMVALRAALLKKHGKLKVDPWRTTASPAVEFHTGRIQ